MDPVYARAIGVDVDELLISQPDTGEQALEIVDMPGGAARVVLDGADATLIGPSVFIAEVELPRG